MNKGAVLHAIGIFLILLSIILLIPLGMAFYYKYTGNPYGNREITAFLLTILSSLLIGVPLTIFFPSSLESLGQREGFAIVTFTWITLVLFGSLPFYISGTCDSFVDAYFETMSGFSTTGASIFRDVEGIPRSLLFWRSLTQGLGGMGIIILSIAILPALGIGGYHLFRAEISGESPFERLKPRIIQIARTTCEVYILLLVIEILFLLLGGMSLFDSICQALGTISTAGLSTRNESIASFHSSYIDFVITIFMFLAGCNFTLHYQIFHGRFREVFKDPQLRFFFSLLLICIVFATLFIRFSPGGDNRLISAFKVASFQVVSIGTTTGFTTADFDKWPDILRFMLVGLMLIGACVGSTGGGIKVIRIIVIFKLIIREFQKLIQPSAVIHIKVNKKSLDSDILSNILGFSMMYIGIFLLCSLIMTGFGLDIITAISSVATTMGGVGPGLGGVGPTCNYSGIPVMGKWVLIICMLLGRLEIYSVMVLFLPLTWRR